MYQSTCIVHFRDLAGTASRISDSKHGILKLLRKFLDLFGVEQFRLVKKLSDAFWDQANYLVWIHVCMCICIVCVYVLYVCICIECMCIV